MTARDRLLGSLAPEVVAAIEELVAERVSEALEANGNGDPAPSMLLSVDEAADALAISRRTLERRIESGEIPVTYFGRRALIARSDLAALIEERRRGRT